MSEPPQTPGVPPELTKEQTRWAFAAATLFLTAIGLLGYAFASGAFLTFALGWVVLQMFGYVGALRFARGDLAHPLFKSQVMLHGMALILLIGLMARGG
ncbi:MAG: pyridoxal phosphate biosynthetic protein [Erythrobacter sp.]|uniref:pyridoxal phosphate biosynthetic protein n=1 Tax=Erythrobacter sp. TaxID=1042 RepID=UPI002636262E|nr:pyridoxal phosphate biosynthetic protein [Erythrobacter sp.]MDJ0977053.1 pyridoxal phosphate biosynthetic protein [Erythrobacter sp.]